MATVVPDRLQRYQERSDPWLFGLALLFLLVWTARIALRDIAPDALHRGLLIVLILIWGLFFADIVTRAVLSGRPGRYLLRHPIDILVVLVPVAQPLKLLAVFATSAAVATRRGRVASGRAVIVSLFLVMWSGAAAMLAVERDAPDANITTFGDAVWWAPVTVFTVGYGDTYPVTLVGRFIAVALMCTGVALIGVVTATVAAWFMSASRSENRAATAPEVDVLNARITALESKIDALLARDGAPDARRE
jgi:voltage-gated potassium channel